MSLSTKLLAGGAAGLALVLSTAAALASPATATASVNVRSGPGTGYAVLDTLYAGEGVDVQRCSGSWCYVVHTGPDGWVSANYLDEGSGGYEPAPVYDEPDYYYQEPPIYVTPPPIIVRPPFHHHRPPFHHRPPHHRPPVKPPVVTPPIVTPPVHTPGNFPPGQFPRHHRDHRGDHNPSFNQTPHVQIPSGSGQTPHVQTPSSGGQPRHFRPQQNFHPRNNGGGDFCATNPTAPACTGGGRGHRNR